MSTQNQHWKHKARNKAYKTQQAFSEKASNENGRRTGFLSSVFPMSSGNFTSRRCALRHLACTSAPDVYVPTSAASVVRSSANWEVKKARRKTAETSAGNGSLSFPNRVARNASSLRTRKQAAVAVQPDLWCSGRLPLTADVASVECFVPSGPMSVSRRSSTFLSRQHNCRIVTRDAGRTVVEQSYPATQYGLDAASAPAASDTMQSTFIVLPRRRVEPSAAGLSEEFLISLSGMRIYDRFRDWRLDVDDMSYEELLELEDRIGYVKTGLREDQIIEYLNKMKCHILERQGTCSICQEEYCEHGDEVGKLKCGHGYHAYCIRDWLKQKSCCPLCKSIVAC